MSLQIDPWVREALRCPVTGARLVDGTGPSGEPRSGPSQRVRGPGGVVAARARTSRSSVLPRLASTTNARPTNRAAGRRISTTSSALETTLSPAGPANRSLGRPKLVSLR